MTAPVRQLVGLVDAAVTSSDGVSCSSLAVLWNNCSKLPAPQTGSSETIWEKAYSLCSFFTLIFRKSTGYRIVTGHNGHCLVVFTTLSL